jgi:hypothetical protein
VLKVVTSPPARAEARRPYAASRRSFSTRLGTKVLALMSHLDPRSLPPLAKRLSLERSASDDVPQFVPQLDATPGSTDRH